MRQSRSWNEASTRGAGGLFADVQVACGDAELGERTFDISTAQHVDTGPAQIAVAIPASAEQCGIQRAPGQRHEGGRGVQHPGFAGDLVGYLAREKARIDGRAQPQDHIGGLMLVPVGRRDKPPGRPGRARRRPGTRPRRCRPA